eukprot:COSAG01_NODE_8431_length_2786_cov_4.016003_1_plen_43_part_00
MFSMETPPPTWTYHCCHHRRETVESLPEFVEDRGHSMVVDKL